AARPPRKREIAELAAGARVENRAIDEVPSVGEPPLDLSDECAEVGRAGARIHLRDDQDPHYARVRIASYMPHSARSVSQISPIVHRARKASRIGGRRFESPSAASRTAASAAEASS